MQIPVIYLKLEEFAVGFPVFYDIAKEQAHFPSEQLCEALTCFLSLFFFFFPLCQFRYKKRVYKQASLDEKQLAKLHTKVCRERAVIYTYGVLVVILLCYL